MLNALITHKGQTLVSTLSSTRMQIAGELASIGILKPAHDIKCKDSEDEDIKVKIYGESEFECKLASFVSDDDTLSFVNTVFEIYHNLPYQNKLNVDISSFAI